MYDLVVIGAGPGGYEAAAYAAKLGMNTALCEMGDLGGTCLNVGCIPTKTLLRSARAFSDCHEAGLYGVKIDCEPTLDMKAVQERKSTVVSTLRKGVAGMLKGAKVDMIQGRAELVRPGRVAVDDRTLETANVLLAMGSVPAVPPIPGLKDSPAVLDSTGILELNEIPESLVVIGGGVIGLEFACFFAEFGSEVTVVEMLPRIAPVVDADIAKRLMSELKRAGITFHLSSRVTGIDGHTLHFTDEKGDAHEITGTVILNSTGRTPVTWTAGLDKAGVDFDRKGVRTDEFGKTNLPGVWAAGDVTGRCLLAHSATREGMVAVNNMAGRADRMRFGAVPSVIYTHPEVAQVGATEEELQARGVAYRKAVVPMAIAGRFTVEYAGKSGTVKVLVSEQHGQILGIHMIGGACGEFVASAAAMIELELCVENVREIVFPHPTVSEALKEAILHV
jgi:dihydrolipoamide dehydrogenase